MFGHSGCCVCTFGIAKYKNKIHYVDKDRPLVVSLPTEDVTSMFHGLCTYITYIQSCTRLWNYGSNLPLSRAMLWATKIEPTLWVGQSSLWRRILPFELELSSPQVARCWSQQAVPFSCFWASVSLRLSLSSVSSVASVWLRGTASRWWQ